MAPEKKDNERLFKSTTLMYSSEVQTRYHRRLYRFEDGI